LKAASQRAAGASLVSIFAFLAVLLNCHTLLAAMTSEDGQQRPFTVADDIELARFDNILTGRPSITVSPNGHRVAVYVQRGLLRDGRLQAELRVYDMASLRAFVRTAPNAQVPRPIWSIKESTYSEGALVSGVRWLRDSRGLAFLLRGNDGKSQLMWTDLKRPRPERLSLAGQDLNAFDIRDNRHYAYTIRSTDVLKRSAQEQSMPAVDVTGRPFLSVLFPDYERTLDDRSDLWAAVGGPLFPVKVSGTTESVVLYDEGQWSMALSPNGRTLAAALPVRSVPAEWETLYPSPSGDAYHIHRGYQSLDANQGGTLVSQYVAIDLLTGKLHPISAAPTGRAAHWVAGGIAATAWSGDGRFLALPSTFVGNSKSSDGGSAPCLAVADVTKETVQCLEQIKPTYTKDGVPTPEYFFIDRLDFSGSSLSMHYRTYNQAQGIQVFSEATSGTWQKQPDKIDANREDIVDLSIDESLNEPPVLMAKDKETQASRAVWDPNPQLKSIRLSVATTYHWADGAGREWTGGLYKPLDYVPGHRYPLVIQTHGFTDKKFLPSGTMTTAFAARALAAVGVVVLQVKGCPVNVSETAEEAPCNVQGYEAAIKKLDADGIIDLDRIGVIGFSRTCYYVMEALTTSNLHLKAASVTDGVNYGYWQYLFAVDLNQDGLARQYEAIYKADPFGDGLQEWIKRSPMFKMQRINTPLLVVGEGAASLLDMWENYAPLRYLHKPTDLVLLRTDEHEITNPVIRMASQGGSVDWFRFWLQGYEDPVSAKAEQYRRWETLCDMQKAENPNQPAFCVNSQQ